MREFRQKGYAIRCKRIIASLSNILKEEDTSPLKDSCADRQNYPSDADSLGMLSSLLSEIAQKVAATNITEH